MKIGIIGAMTNEIHYLINSLDDVKEKVMNGIKIFQTKINLNEVYIIQCGIGKINASIAASLLILKCGCELVINSGIAGGVKPLKTREIVLGKALAYNDVDVTFFGYKYGQVAQMPENYQPKESDLLLIENALDKLNLQYKEVNIYSGDKFVTSLEPLKLIPDSGYAVEMEGAAIAQTAYRFGARFIILRFISDIIGEPSQIDDYSCFENEMAETSSKICLNVLKSL